MLDPRGSPDVCRCAAGFGFGIIPCLSVRVSVVFGLVGRVLARFLSCGLLSPAFVRLRALRYQRPPLGWAGYLALSFRYSRLWQLRKSFDLLFISICLLVYCVFVVTLLARQSLCGIVKALRYHTHSPPLLFHDTKSDSIRSSVISRSFDLPTTRQNSPSLPPHTPISPLSTAGLSAKASQNLSRHSAATSG